MSDKYNQIKSKRLTVNKEIDKLQTILQQIPACKKGINF